MNNITDSDDYDVLSLDIDMKLDNQDMDEQDLFMFDCFDHEEAITILPLKEEKSVEQELLENVTADIKRKKELLREMNATDIKRKKKKRKYDVSHRNRRPSSNKTTRSYTAPELPRETTSAAFKHQGLHDASINQAYQDTLYNLALSMKRSAFSRMQVIQYSFPIPNPMLVQTKLSSCETLNCNLI